MELFGSIGPRSLLSINMRDGESGCVGTGTVGVGC
jgi:hypothetical protein